MRLTKLARTFSGLVFAAALLSGCLVTDDPLINASSAAYPFSDGEPFDVLEYNYQSSGGAKTNAIRIIRNGIYYEPVRESGGSEDPFLIRAIDATHFAAQIEDPDSVSGYPYFYTLFVQEGDRWSVYAFDHTIDDKAGCGDLTSGQTGGFGAREYYASCIVSSFDGMARMMLTMLASDHYRPDYILVRQ